MELREKLHCFYVRPALNILFSPNGIDYNKEVNATARGKEIELSTSDSKVAVWVVPTNEELVIAKDAFALHNA